MSFKFHKTSIEGLIRIDPHYFSDERGYFIKDFEKEIFSLNGLPTEFYEVNESKSKKGTLRGLHFQNNFSQGKLIRVIKGAVYDVAVDLRKDSKTFGKWEGFYLSEKDHNMLYIPKNFAHGFLTLEDDTIFSYKCTDKYSPVDDSGIIWNDEELAIKWPLELVSEKLIISEKDSNLQSFKEYKSMIHHCIKGSNTNE